MTTIAKRTIDQALTPDYSNVPLLLSEKQAAQFIGLSVSYLRKSRCKGVRKGQTPPPPFVQVNGRIFYRRDDSIAWVSARETRHVIGGLAQCRDQNQQKTYAILTELHAAAIRVGQKREEI